MTCPFCNLNKNEIIAESEYAVAKLDGFPVSEGHALIISKRHVADFFDLSDTEQQDMVKLLNVVKKNADEQLKTRDYNFGVNCGSFAGQTVDHVHMHLIPRLEGDIEDPKGGVRWVIPRKAKYWDE